MFFVCSACVFFFFFFFFSFLYFFVVLRVFCLSLDNDATHAKHAQACFFLCCTRCGNFWQKTKLSLNSVNIRRFCTGKRDVFCKKHCNLCFFRKTSVFLNKATQRTRSIKKTRPGVCVLFLLCVRSPPPRSLTHSLAFGSLAEIAI